MSDLHIRQATIDDCASLSKLAAKTFFNTYFAILPELGEMLKSYVENNFCESQMEQELLNKNSQYYMLFFQTELIGYAKTTIADPFPTLNYAPSLEFQRMYLDETKVRNGLGTIFLNHLIQIARQAGYKSVWTAAYDQNIASINFQLKHGFIKVGERKFVHAWAGKVYEDNEWVFELPL